MVVEYKMECYWSQHSGWNFSFGQKKLWETKNGYTVADIIGGGIENREVFTDLTKALDYMRINKR